MFSGGTKALASCTTMVHELEICTGIGYTGTYMSKSFDPAKPYDDLPLLPPPASAIETLPVLRKEASARQLLGELRGIANIIPNQTILINAVVLREARDSSGIENIITTQDRLYRAISVSSSAGVDSATKEVVSYREALRFGEGLIGQRKLLSPNDICAIQAMIVKNDAGVRRAPGTALVSEATGKSIYTPPQDPAVVRRLLANFAQYFNTRASTLADMAALHYQFEAIHPFYDGNGRTGRILNILYLILKGFLDLPILYLSSRIIERKEDYYTLIQNVTSAGAWEPWILFILDAVEQTARRTRDQVLQIKRSLEQTIAEVKSRVPRIYSKELVEALYVHPYCKVGFLVESIGVERKAASRYLHQLERLGILTAHTMGRENIFVNNALMNVLSQS